MKKLILASMIFVICLTPVSSYHVINGQNIFKVFFTEMIEISYIITWDGMLYGFTTNHETKVEISYETVKKDLEEKGIKISDIAFMVHNHFAKPWFSDSDLDTWKQLKRDGFLGSYCIYIRSSGKVKYLKDETSVLLRFLKNKETKKFLKEFKKQYPKAYKELLTFIKGVKNG